MSWQLYEQTEYLKQSTLLVFVSIRHSHIYILKLYHTIVGLSTVSVCVDIILQLIAKLNKFLSDG